MNKRSLLDDEPDNDVDLASYAYQIWQNAITQDPSLEGDVSKLPSGRLFYATAPPDRDGTGRSTYLYANR